MLDGIPTQLRAGDTWQWSTAASCYPASDGWTLSTAFRGAGSLDVDGVADGDGWISTGDAADTASLAAGRYSWISRVSLAGAVHTLASGVLEVLPDLTAATGTYDGRSDAEKQLAAAEEALTKLLGKQHASVSFGDQSFTLQDIEKLMKVRDRLKDQVAAEKREANGGKGRRILVEFSGR